MRDYGLYTEQGIYLGGIDIGKKRMKRDVLEFIRIQRNELNQTLFSFKKAFGEKLFSVEDNLNERRIRILAMMEVLEYLNKQVLELQ